MIKKVCLSKGASGTMRAALCGFAIVALLLFAAQPGMAVNFSLGGTNGKLMGYINQGVTYGVGGNEIDTKDEIQSALFQLLLEVQLDFNPQLRFFASAGINADWAYPMLSDNSEWDKKQFDRSRDDLYIFSHRRDLLHEFHLTWTPGNWYFRAGKQIVVWGETDGFRLMDQINPLDQRRGMTDVEFETTILPIWLIRAEYYFDLDSSWLQDLGLEFVFNPNLDFRGDEAIVPGNQNSGIWAPYVEVPLGGAYPNDFAYLGSYIQHLDRPGSTCDDDGFEYALRIKSVIHDTLITLNAFYGRDNVPVLRAGADAPRMGVYPGDGRFILHPHMEGKYPLMRFVGFTLTRDFDQLYIKALGGIGPVLRVEAFYAFDNTFVTNDGRFEQYDEFRWMVGFDWKVWMRFLNPRAAFMISPQFYHRKIRDYPGVGLNGLRDDNYQASFMINTTYFHNKLEPSFFWLRDVSTKSNMFKYQLKYEYSDKWNYTLGVLLFDGAKTGQGFEPLTNKDQVYFTIGYRF